MDILELSLTEEKYKYLVLVVDCASKWCEAFSMKSQEATVIADVLFREIIAHYSAPRTIVSDRGQNYMSKLVSALCELLQVKRHYTSAYHPQTNATCEWMNSFKIQSLKMHCENQTDWPKYIGPIMMAYRLTKSTESLQISPFRYLYGQKMRST